MPAKLEKFVCYRLVPIVKSLACSIPQFLADPWLCGQYRRQCVCDCVAVVKMTYCPLYF